MKTPVKRKKARNLYPHSGFLIGVGSVFGIAGNYYRFNTSPSDEQADLDSLDRDWKKVGDYFYEQLTR